MREKAGEERTVRSSLKPPPQLELEVELAMSALAQANLKEKRTRMENEEFLALVRSVFCVAWLLGRWWWRRLLCVKRG